MKLSVIIVSYNVRHYVEQCLHSVFKSIHEGQVEAEVLVVDNNSPDNTAGYLTQRFPASKYPNLRILSNSRNIGFGRANNRGLRRASGEYVLFLNPDTIITEHTLTDVLSFADKHADLGALGARMIDASGVFARESRRGLPTPWVSFCKMTGLCQMFPQSRRFGRYYLNYLPMDQPAEVDIVSGAFMLCRREALERVGGFDKDFFMYGEDIDLSYRLHKSGCHNYYYPTTVLHYKGESTKKNTYRYVHTFYEAMLIFYRKHFQSSAFITFPIRAAIYGRAVLALLEQQIDSLRKFVYAANRPRADLYVYDATAPNAECLEDIAERNGIDLLKATEPKAQSPVDAIIFNTDETSYAEMLSNIEQNPAHDYALGIFNPHTGVLTACHQTYG